METKLVALNLKNNQFAFSSCLPARNSSEEFDLWSHCCRRSAEYHLAHSDDCSYTILMSCFSAGSMRWSTSTGSTGSGRSTHSCCRRTSSSSPGLWTRFRWSSLDRVFRSGFGSRSQLTVLNALKASLFTWARFYHCSVFRSVSTCSIHEPSVVEFSSADGAVSGVFTRTLTAIQLQRSSFFLESLKESSSSSLDS